MRQSGIFKPYWRPTSSNWPHTIYNQFNKDSVSREGDLGFENLKKSAVIQNSQPEKPPKPKETQVQAQPQSRVQIPFAISSEEEKTSKPASRASKPKSGATTKTKIKKEKTATTDVSPPFDSNAFKAKWAEWLAYRKELKCSYKSSRAIKQIFTQLSKYQEAFVLELIDTSMANEWRGLVFPRTGELYEQWLQKQALAKEKQVPKQGIYLGWLD